MTQNPGQVMTRVGHGWSRLRQKGLASTTGSCMMWEAEHRTDVDQERGDNPFHNSLGWPYGQTLSQALSTDCWWSISSVSA